MTKRLTRRAAAAFLIALFCVTGCENSSKTQTVVTNDKNEASSKNPQVDAQPEQKASSTANSNDVKAARARILAAGSQNVCVPKEGDLLKEIVIPDGANLKADDLVLFGKLSDLEKLQIFNCRILNDEMASHISGLANLKSLALTNTVINDNTVEMIVKSFPNLTELDLSSNTNMSNGVMKIISGLTKLQRLTLVQNKINDIGAQRLSKLKELRTLDLRGNMEASDMALDVIADLPKLTGFKHRSTAVTDTGLEQLSRNQTLESILLQDFAITGQSGQHLAKLGKLSQLEIFRCQGFDSDGVLALKGLGLIRLTLRDLPNIDDRAMEVFDDLPKLKRLYLVELPSIGNTGLKHLSSLASLELLECSSVPLMTDATVEVIAALPKLKELSLKSTGVTDKSIETILKMPALQALTFKDNGSVTAEGVKKLTTKKWTKLDLGASGPGENE